MVRIACGLTLHCWTNERVSYSWRGISPDSPSVDRVAISSQRFHDM
jgi:hypothetical protein